MPDAASLSDYLAAGLIYVYAGCRERANGTNADGSAFAGGAPWGATDLKAAVRCIRYNASRLPGDADRVVSSGMSGGAQSAILGVTGNSDLYTAGSSYDASTYVALSGWNESYPGDYKSDLELGDDQGCDMTTRTHVRTHAYTPLYDLPETSEGRGTSNVAPHWRIRTGIEQGDTSLTTEMNLAYALEAMGTVEDVDFETVWGKGHTMAERTGSSTENFISWPASIMA